MSTTLACLLPSLRNKRTTVELRNESFVTGRVVQTDGFMNVTMAEVTFTDALGNKSKFDSFFAQSRLIRYVQIPSNVDIKQALHSFTEGMGRGRGRGRGRGEVSRGRMKIMSEREQRRQEDIRNALKMKEVWKKEKEEKRD